jgi:hypothetical protein
MPRNIQGMTFLTEEERDALQFVMDDQASQEKVHNGDRSWADYWSKIKSALHNPVTLTSATWNFFYFWVRCVLVYCFDLFDVMVKCILQ